MKLKKLLEGFAWERVPGRPLPTMKDVAKNHKVNEADFRPGDKFGGRDGDDGDEGYQGEFDYKYYKGQIDATLEALEAVEEELIRDLEQRSDDDMYRGSSAAQQAENQARRYIQGAEKQLEGLAKMLDRLESQGEL